MSFLKVFINYRKRLRWKVSQETLHLCLPILRVFARGVALTRYVSIFQPPLRGGHVACGFGGWSVEFPDIKGSHPGSWRESLLVFFGSHSNWNRWNKLLTWPQVSKGRTRTRFLSYKGFLVRTQYPTYDEY